MDLYNFNPWWKDGKVPSELLGKKRKIFSEINGYLDKRQMLLFTGLRRVGKTTLMYQIIDVGVSSHERISETDLRPC